MYRMRSRYGLQFQNHGILHHNICNEFANVFPFITDGNRFLSNRLQSG